MAIFRKGKEISNQLHEGKGLEKIYHLGKMYMLQWLRLATQQAIVEVFGSAEGTQVISKTNDYLNLLAKTDPQRAQQMADFINEDPLLVCSLVETSKTRGVSNSVGAYFLCGYYKCTQNTDFVFDAKITVASGTYPVPFTMGEPYSSNKQLWLSSPTLIGYGYGGKSSLGVATITIERHKLSVIGSVFYVDGEMKHEVAYREFVNSNPTSQISIFARDNNGVIDRHCQGVLWGAEICEDNQLVHHFVPLQRNGQMELLDLVTGTLATRVGTFTEQLTDKV